MDFYVHICFRVHEEYRLWLVTGTSPLATFKLASSHSLGLWFGLMVT